MSSIITQGYGVKKNAIITKGYGRSIEEIVVEVVGRLTQRRIGGSTRKDYINEDKEECITILASLVEANNEDLSEPIENEIKRCFKETDLNINIKSIKVSSVNSSQIQVEVTLKAIDQIKSNTSVVARIKKKLDS